MFYNNIYMLNIVIKTMPREESLVDDEVVEIVEEPKPRKKSCKCSIGLGRNPRCPEHGDQDKK